MAVDAAVVEWIRVNVLDEDMISDVVQELRERLAQRAKPTALEAPEIEIEMRQLRAEMERLSLAIVSTNEAPTMLVEMLKEREQRLRVLEGKLANARESTEAPAIDMANIDTIARNRLRRLTTMMQRNPVEARNAIEAIVGGPLRFVPIETGQGKRYRIEGPMGAANMAVMESG